MQFQHRAPGTDEWSDLPSSDGLTDEEGEVMDALFDAFNAYTLLPVQHPDEPGEFRYHIHMLQGLLACRIARRDYPAGWSTTPQPGDDDYIGEFDGTLADGLDDCG